MLNKPELSGEHSPRQNHLLAALPAADYARLLPDLELIPMPLGRAVYESGGTQGYAHFPTTGIVSLLYVLEDGACAEIAVTGFDGLVGIALFLGGDSTPNRAVVQSAGFGYRLRASVLKREFNLNGEFTRLMLRYTQALFTQMAQTAVCNRRHGLEQQLCRCLLMSLDRLPTNELAMTHDMIANKLGVRREGVTEAAGVLQRAGIIRYSRGHITVLDRPKLEQRVCECYAVVKREMDRLSRVGLIGLRGFSVLPVTSLGLDQPADHIQHQADDAQRQQLDRRAAQMRPSVCSTKRPGEQPAPARTPGGDPQARSIAPSLR